MAGFFTSAFVNVRLVTPASSAFAFAATIGAGTTAQLGAMKINEEVDALAVMGIRPIAYLASTRVVAGMIVVVPLYCVALLMSFFSVRVITTVFLRAGLRSIRPLLRHLSRSAGRALLVRRHGRRSSGDHADPHVLRPQRHRRTRGRRRGGRTCHPDIADRVANGDSPGHPGPLRPDRQLQLRGVTR